MTDRAPLLAAGIFAAATAFGAAVSLKEDVRGAPMGLEVPGSVGMHVAAGWGSGLTAPWPMPALALGAAVFADPEARWARPTLVGIGIAILVGTAIEPVTWGRRGRSPLIAAAVSFNLAFRDLPDKHRRRNATDIPSSTGQWPSLTRPDWGPRKVTQQVVKKRGRTPPPHGRAPAQPGIPGRAPGGPVRSASIR